MGVLLLLGSEAVARLPTAYELPYYQPWNNHIRVAIVFNICFDYNQIAGEQL